MMCVSDMTGQDSHGTDLKARLLARIECMPGSVWSPVDFADAAPRAAENPILATDGSPIDPANPAGLSASRNSYLGTLR